MPYISKQNNRRKELQNGATAQSAGELNYQIFYYIKHNRGLFCGEDRLVIEKFINQFLGDKPNYQKYNDMTGVLVRCYAEVERRLDCNAIILYEILGGYDDEIAKYEDIKIKENGDVE